LGIIAGEFAGYTVVAKIYISTYIHKPPVYVAK